MRFNIIVLLLLFIHSLFSQTYKINQKLDWNSDQANEFIESFENLNFSSAQKWSGNEFLPLYKKEIDLPSKGNIDIQLIPIQEHQVRTDKSLIETHLVDKEFRIQSKVLSDRGKTKAIIEFIPIRQSLDPYEWIVLNEFELIVQFSPEFSPAPKPNFTRESVLNNGLYYRIGVANRGLFKIDWNFIQNELKIDPNTINPKSIKIYGNGGEMLAESNDDPFVDDLKENAIYVSGETDGRFDQGDFILFYANGPDSYSYDPVSENFNYRKNIYSSQSNYFLRLDGLPGKRISTIPSASNPDHEARVGFDFKQYENDLVNLLDVDPGGEGSGKDWYGEELSNSRELDFGSYFIFDQVDLTRKGKFSYSFAGRSPTSSTLKVTVEDKTSTSSMSSVVYSSISRFANLAKKTEEFQPVSDKVNAKISFPQISGVSSEGWLDYMRVSVWKKLIWNNKPLFVLDPESKNFNVSSFIISNANPSLQVWDISEPLEVNFIQSTLLAGNEMQFAVSSKDQIRSFYIVDPALSFPPPTYLGTAGNQNLHGLDDIDMLIVYYKDFKSEAERLMEHRTKHSGFKIAAVDISQIYNEFSSGTQDPSAIRNMARMLYERNPKFRFLLLFGDGSYDLRYINKKDPDQNFIVSYETDESIDPINAFPTDDYFALLDPGEGKNLDGKLDICVGRLVARSEAEAKNLVDKIIRYDTDPKTMEDWKLNTLFSSDDEDSNIHFNQAESIASQTKTNHPLYNQDKIHIDAYEQITTPGGERYPEANKAFANAFFQGTLVVNYLGHGGYTGLAQERIFQNTDIKNFENYYRLPLVIVASCTFNGYDDPSKTNAGEEGLHNPRGGFLALFSTVRAVYSDDNFDLTTSVYKYLFNFENGMPLTLGEVMRRAKNEHSTGFIKLNSRKFLLFGDPSQTLAIPRLKNIVSEINGNDPNLVTDTLRALEKVNIKGFVADQSDVLQSQFNGKLYVTVFDKEIKLRTKANDNSSYVADYPLQKNIIYKGLVEVKQGLWEVDFIIPKDINYEFGSGKISLYATDEISQDAAGFENRFIVGGVTKEGLSDDDPPVVEVFMNNEFFKSGGICDRNPILYAKISDDVGINISGNSIGHDLTAVIDKDSRNPIILNQSYKTKLNNPKEGELSYPLKNLSPGKHNITVTAWDISNNYGTGTVEFFVLEDGGFLLNNVFCYPNPFSDQTKFQFETNVNAQEIAIRINIFSLNGLLVKTLSKSISNPGYRVEELVWDGYGDGGNEIPNGMYVYNLELEATSGGEILKKTTDFQKLILHK